MELIATPGAATANSYVTLATATALLAGRLETEPWFAYSDTVTVDEAVWRNSAALIWATRLLDEQVGWYGMPATTTQALGWPRSGAFDGFGRLLDATTVPATMQLATTLYALELVRAMQTTQEAITTTGIKVQQFGDTRLEFFAPSTTPPTVPSHTLPVEIRRMLTVYGQVSGGMTVPLVRT